MANCFFSSHLSRFDREDTREASALGRDSDQSLLWIGKVFLAETLSNFLARVVRSLRQPLDQGVSRWRGSSQSSIIFFKQLRPQNIEKLVISPRLTSFKSYVGRMGQLDWTGSYLEKHCQRHNGPRNLETWTKVGTNMAPLALVANLATR